MKPPKHGTLGLLVFDEVKINECLVFDYKNWELVGFTGLLDDEFPGKNGKASTIKPTNKLATHVLQFFFRSLFLKFDYQCAFFLRENLTSLQLNRMFWLGVSMLHMFEFDILVSCSDGASCNRSLIEIIVTDGKSYCQNIFSTMPLFFLSDPPLWAAITTKNTSNAKRSSIFLIGKAKTKMICLALKWSSVHL